MTTYAHLLHPEYRHTYALFVYTTGEVYTSSNNEARLPLRLLWRKLDGLRREWRCDYHLHAALVNLNTGCVIEEIYD